jgi:lysine 6-dehydrogenase
MPFKEVAMGYRYAIIGTGRQGTAAAYDLGLNAEAELILMADANPDAAQAAVERVNTLLGREVATPTALDARDTAGVQAELEQHRIQAMLAATPYYMNLGLTEMAIAAGVSMTDLGGNSDVVFAQLKLSLQAEQTGVSIVPDCGLGPGMITTLALYAMEALDEPQDVFIWDCGLPQKPTPPWNYRLGFSIEGLTNEYYGDCVFIRDGKTTLVPALEELELIEFPAPIGTLEAFTTAGGITSAARTFAGHLRTLQNKTMRYPGHFAALKVIQQLGLLSNDPIDVDGQQIRPRSVLHTLWEPQIRARSDERDFALIRAVAKGSKDGVQAEAQVDLALTYDEATGFSAMEQGTGWHASILTAAAAVGEITPGVVPVELAMSGAAFVKQAERRGFDVKRDLRLLEA